MLYLEIQNWAEATQTSEFKQENGGTEECMRIPTRGTKACDKLK